MNTAFGNGLWKVLIFGDFILKHCSFNAIFFFYEMYNRSLLNFLLEEYVLWKLLFWSISNIVPLTFSLFFVEMITCPRMKLFVFNHFLFCGLFQMFPILFGLYWEEFLGTFLPATKFFFQQISLRSKSLRIFVLSGLMNPVADLERLSANQQENWLQFATSLQLFFFSLTEREWREKGLLTWHLMPRGRIIHFGGLAFAAQRQKKHGSSSCHFWCNNYLFA